MYVDAVPHDTFATLARPLGDSPTRNNETNVSVRPGRILRDFYVNSHVYTSMSFENTHEVFTVKTRVIVSGRIVLN